MKLVKTLRVIVVVSSSAAVLLAFLASLGYWQSNQGYFIKCTPISKPANFIRIGPNPDQQRAIDNPDQFIRIGFTLDKYNFEGFNDILPEFDNNIEVAEYVPPEYKDFHLKYFHVTIKYVETPLAGLHDFGAWVLDLGFWLIVSCFTAIGTFGMMRYLKEDEASERSPEMSIMDG